jgi:dGTPase
MDYNKCLKEKAFLLSDSKDRKNKDDGDKKLFGVSDDFLIDCMKIVQSKCFRRLYQKTQVFCFPDNPHVRTRLTHTLETDSINTLMADVLGLNVNLVHAGSNGHDVGHVPFGHVGERFLSQYTKKPFEHNVFGPIILEYIERGGRGLNLKTETLQAIRVHSGGDFKKELELEEYKLIKLGDKISYLFSDVNDAVRYNYLSSSKIPECLEKLGKNQRERVINCIFALFEESSEKRTVSFSDSEVAKLYQETRDWMFENVYARANTRIINEELSLAFEAILEYPKLRKYDPVVIFSVLTEDGVREIAQKGLSAERVEYLGINEIIPHLERGKKYYDEYYPS